MRLPNYYSKILFSICKVYCDETNRAIDRNSHSDALTKARNTCITWEGNSNYLPPANILSHPRALAKTKRIVGRDSFGPYNRRENKSIHYSPNPVTQEKPAEQDCYSLDEFIRNHSKFILDHINNKNPDWMFDMNYKNPNQLIIANNGSFNQRIPHSEKVGRGPPDNFEGCPNSNFSVEQRKLQKEKTSARFENQNNLAANSLKSEEFLKKSTINQNQKAFSDLIGKKINSNLEKKKIFSKINLNKIEESEEYKKLKENIGKLKNDSFFNDNSPFNPLDQTIYEEIFKFIEKGIIENNRNRINIHKLKKDLKNKFDKTIVHRIIKIPRTKERALCKWRRGLTSFSGKDEFYLQYILKYIYFLDKKGFYIKFIDEKSENNLISASLDCVLIEISISGKIKNQFVSAIMNEYFRKREKNIREKVKGFFNVLNWGFSKTDKSIDKIHALAYYFNNEDWNPNFSINELSNYSSSDSDSNKKKRKILFVFGGERWFKKQQSI